jgi:hypothetical protein
MLALGQFLRGALHLPQQFREHRVIVSPLPSSMAGCFRRWHGSLTAVIDRFSWSKVRRRHRFRTCIDIRSTGRSSRLPPCGAFRCCIRPIRSSRCGCCGFWPIKYAGRGSPSSGDSIGNRNAWHRDGSSCCRAYQASAPPLRIDCSVTLDPSSASSPLIRPRWRRSEASAARRRDVSASSFAECARPPEGWPSGVCVHTWYNVAS